MRKLTLLCIAASFFGGFAAVVWLLGPRLENATFAQESVLRIAPPGDYAAQTRQASEVFSAPYAPQNGSGTPYAPPNGPAMAGGVSNGSAPPVNSSPMNPAGQNSYSVGAMVPNNSPPINVPPDLPPQINPADFQALTPEEQTNVLVYQNVNRSVVNINTRGIEAGRFLVIEILAEGEGSGSVLDKQGHILTNYHVIDGAKEIQVTLCDGNSYDARVVGGDPFTDIAVLQIDAPPDALFPITLGNSSSLMVGQKVFAIGNPFGMERTLTTGIISSLNRTLPVRKASKTIQRTIKSVIQIDASINPGNSGGPLLDTHGWVIGMNTAIASRTGDSAGIGFAVPSNTIGRVVTQLIRNGRVIRPESGIARVYQIPGGGLRVETLTPLGAAEKAGLQGPKIEKKQKRQGPFVTEYQTIDRAAADTIIAVDGQPIKTADDFLGMIEAKQPGDQVLLTVQRDGKQRQVPLRLDAVE